MRLEFERISSLPRLAWGARLRRNDPAVRILHGPWLETRDDCFFEGAWDGPLRDYRFDQAITFAGSGGRLTGDAILFAAPSHTFQMLYSLPTGEERFVSNSLAFLLALSGERLDPTHRHYYLDFVNYNHAGISVTAKRLRLAGPRFVELYDCCNLAVQPDLTASRLEKSLGPPPRDFSEYASFLLGTAERVFANANDVVRQWVYRPVTCLSQGYDTTAVSALAAKAGCREAVSFRKSNSKSGYADDSGSKIAPYLGLHLTEYERTDYDRLAETRDYEFYMEPGGVDRSMVLMEQQLAGALLLTGRFGERLWEREWWTRLGLAGDAGHPLFQMPTGFKLGGCALGEFRMKTGFIHFPLACSGGLHAPAIKTITYSRAMKPWSVGGSYDRPIARRIAEEAGVPRHLFGQVKKGGGPRRSGRRRRSWIGRVIYSLWLASYWPPVRVLILRMTGNRLNPAWRRGSFGVQRGVERMTQDYLSAISGTKGAAG
ncbi:MAG TPA: hypothetical protein VME17_16865 [Bryobacteraceae bacterium]|nr:hypothetical protein [Bryobacteraceae bacterium]